MLLNSPIRLLVALALTATLVVSQDQEPRCPVNQQWYPLCKPCIQPCGAHVSCAAVCEPGCACKPGYTTQTLDSAECIPKDKCIICEGLKVYDRCRGLCPPSCKPKMCPAICAPGCICKPGYVWHDEKCIPESECPK
ncbi:zonadhesin-like [Xenopus tropicalis]|uniref:Zonadhesin-like n=1 Tax=Xenopus tropicalis TaxID=8364 RepID=A0A8J1JUZ5_XENTR|nr:zonadhesin-like [Xenopus tropicalis]